MRLKAAVILVALMGVCWSSHAGTQGHVKKLVLELEGLSSMKGQHYEGWNIVHGQAVSTGRFSIGKNGSIYSVNVMGRALKKIGHNGKATFRLKPEAVHASTFVLTIEPNGDQDATPSSVHVMGGGFSHHSADLSVDHGSSIGTNFSGSMGKFILAAPTGGMDNQGVWFVNPALGMGSLSLPQLPTGWVYEGWIVNTSNDKKLSTGLFLDTNARDSDGAGPFAGKFPLSFPPVPGQDIVKTSIVLDDGIHAIVVSVEPYPDFDPAPYDIKILLGSIEKNAMGKSPIAMENISAMTVPRGKASIK